MKKKHVLLFGFLLFISPLLSKGQHHFPTNVKSELLVTGNTDIDYKKLERLLDSVDHLLSIAVDTIDQNSLFELTLHKEILFSVYRSIGIKLWKMYPNDERKYSWFRFTTLNSSPNIHYWRVPRDGLSSYFTRLSNSSSYDAEINWRDLIIWEQEYPKMKDEYLEYLKRKGTDSTGIFLVKALFDIRDLEFFLKMSQNSKYRTRDGNKKIDLKLLEKLSMQATSFLGLDTTGVNTTFKRKFSSLKGQIELALDNELLAVYRAFELIDNDLHLLIKRFIEEGNNGQKEWGMQRRTLLNLKSNPLELREIATDGRVVNLNEMRGKVVLVDFWSTYCGGCIARMPTFKDVYDKYKHSGFEVISVCVNGAERTEELKRVVEKIGADWPVVSWSFRNEESMGQKVFRKYGFYGVPQLLLLNKDGKMEMLNDILRDGDFEPLLKQLLARPYSDK